MNKALIVVDYTNDFVATDGKLTCGEAGQAIEGKITDLIESFVHDGAFVFFANDLHYENDPYHPESNLFPEHNIVGTTGRELYGTVQQAFDRYRNQVISFDKTRYSSFAGTNLLQLLRERSVTEIHVVGVCTDICILHTAVDAYNLGFSTVIHRDAVASFNAAGHEWALEHFKNCLGAEVV